MKQSLSYPFNVNLLFVERETDLINLARALKVGKTVAVDQIATTGLEGIGEENHLQRGTGQRSQSAWLGCAYRLGVRNQRHPNAERSTHPIFRELNHTLYLSSALKAPHFPSRTLTA